MKKAEEEKKKVDTSANQNKKVDQKAVKGKKEKDAEKKKEDNSREIE